jgi:hypothetical protein
MESLRLQENPRSLRQALIQKVQKASVDFTEGRREDELLIGHKALQMIFAVGSQTVKNWAREKVLPSVRMDNGEYRFPATAIWEILEADPLWIEDDKFLTTAQVAKILRVGSHTVKKRSNRGLIPYVTTPTKQHLFPASGVHKIANSSLLTVSDK